MFQFEKGFTYLFRSTLGTAAAILILLFVYRTLQLLFSRFFRIKDQTRKRFPGLEKKANRYLRMVQGGVQVLLILLGAGVVAQIWGIPVSAFVLSDAGTKIILRAMAIAFTVATVVGLTSTIVFFFRVFVEILFFPSYKKNRVHKC